MKRKKKKDDGYIYQPTKVHDENPYLKFIREKKAWYKRKKKEREN